MVTSFETSFDIKTDFITSRSLNWVLLRGCYVILNYNSFVLYRRHGFYFYEIEILKSLVFLITKKDFFDRFVFYYFVTIKNKEFILIVGFPQGALIGPTF